MFAIASFGCTLPHFFYGDELLHANNAFYAGGSTSLAELMLKDANNNGSVGGRTESNLNLCKIPDSSYNGTGDSTRNNSQFPFIRINARAAVFWFLDLIFEQFCSKKKKTLRSEL